MVLKLIDQIERDYVVDRSHKSSPSFALEASLASGRPVVILNPPNTDQAGVEVVFTSFPGLVVRFGEAHLEFFPSCGCDACAETFEDEAERLSWWLDQVIAGRYRALGEDDYEIWDLEGNRRAGGIQHDRNALQHWQPWTPS